MIIDQMKKDRMTAMREGKKDVKNVLTTFIGDVESDQKRGVVVDDSYVMKRLKKAIQTCDENYKLVADEKYLAEKEILSPYLPQMVDEETIKKSLFMFASLNKHQELNMGAAMKFLKEMHGDLLDGKMASGVVKKFLDTK